MLFVSERDGNMEIYKGNLKGVEGDKRNFERLTYSPSLQVGPIYPDVLFCFGDVTCGR